MPAAPKPLVNRPLAPSTVNSAATPMGTIAPAKPSSREYLHFRKVQLTASQVQRKDGQVDAEQLVRVLKLLQDGAADGSFASRCAPDVVAITVQRIPMINGAQITVRHGLGYAFTGWQPVRQYASSQPFAAVEQANNGGQDPAQFLVLHSSANGVFDLKIW